MAYGRVPILASRLVGVNPPKAFSSVDIRAKHSLTEICHGGLVPDRGDKGMRYVSPRIAAIGMLPYISGAAHRQSPHCFRNEVTRPRVTHRHGIAAIGMLSLRLPPSPIIKTRAGCSQCSVGSALQRLLEVDAITPSSPGSSLLRRGASNPCRPARATQPSL